MNPGADIVRKICEQGEAVEFSGHIRHGDTILLMFKKKDKDEMTYIETDPDRLDQLMEELEIAREGIQSND